jgi:EF-P beta-lysylation protein EpmB
MITENSFQSQHPLEKWQLELRNAVTDPSLLLQQLNLDVSLLKTMGPVIEQFSLRVPQGFINRMQKGNSQDPLLLQILPLNIELQQQPGFSLDPLQEQYAIRKPGLLHKYKDRVLFTFTGVCAIHCRYCFRRHFPYEINNAGRTGWNQSLDYITKHSEIKEVILSGGDPLMLKDSLLQEFIEKIAAIEHVTRLRIHSRMPIVLPERITNEFCQVLTQTRLKAVMVVHANHANEINNDVKTAIKKLHDFNIVVFNQSVLLKNINDNASALVNLSEALFASGIIPYYLHLLDNVQGSAHFAVSERIAKELIWEVIKELPGYLVPKLVREHPGAPAKLAIT